MTDYDGERLMASILVLGKDGDTDPTADYWHQISVREDAAYLLGVSVGLLLGRGGAR